MIRQVLIRLLFISASAFASETRVFIGTGEKGIYTSVLNQKDGTLSAPLLATEMQSTGFLVKHPEKPILYSTGQATKNQGCVLAYKIEKDGRLTEISKKLTQGGRLCHLSLDATSKVLMGANYGEGSVVSFLIQSDGSIAKLASHHQHKGSSVNPKRQTKPHAHSIYSGPHNKFAYAPDLGIDKVMIYNIDPATAKLTSVGHAVTPPGAGPRHMKFGKNGKNAYVLNELDLTISVFAHDANSGKLTLLKNTSTLPEEADKSGMSCSEIRVSQNGKFIYCANRDTQGKGRDTLSVFTVSENGNITRIQTIAAEVWIPRNINLDPSGKWLIVAGQRSNNVPVFKIDSTTGKLSHTGKQILAPKAMCIEFSPIPAG